MSTLPGLLDAPSLKRPADPTVAFLGVRELRQIVEAHLLNAVDQLTRTATRWLWERPPRTREYGISKQILSGPDFVWQLFTSPQNIRPGKLVREIANQARLRAREVKQPPQPVDEAARSLDSQRSTGFGTYIYPHVWVGAAPEQSFEEKLRQAISSFPEFHFVPKIPAVVKGTGDERLVITRDGLVAVTGWDRADALTIVNATMATCVLHGTPAFAVRDDELAEIEVNETTHEVSVRSATLSLPRMLPEVPMKAPNWLLEHRPVAPLEELAGAAGEVLKTLEDPVLTDSLLLFEEIYTHYQRMEYAQTVLLTMVLLERVAFDLAPEVPAPTAMRMVERSLALGDDMSRDFSILRRLRSQILHRGVLAVDRNEAESAVSLALHAMRMLGFPASMNAK